MTRSAQGISPSTKTFFAQAHERHLRRLFDLPATRAPGVDRSKPLVLYGAGGVGRDLLSILTENGYTVLCFLDRAATPGQECCGVPVYLPDHAGPGFEERRQLCVIVAIFNHEVDVGPILGLLRSLGYGRVMSFVDAHDELSPIIRDRFWLTRRTLYREHSEVVEACLRPWDDEASARLFLSVIEFRLTGNYDVLPSPDFEHHYCRSDLPVWDMKPVRYVDCGAYLGETIRAVVENYGPVEAIAAFEPDPENYRRLHGFFASHQDSLPSECTLWPCALWSEVGTVTFSGSGRENSCVSEQGLTTVTCVALDQAIPFFRPTVIKYDVEGAEMEALQGARRVIEAFRPTLAVSLYHKPSHLWEIPFLLDSWRVGYHFHLGLHGHNAFDLVLYAVPDL